MFFLFTAFIILAIFTLCWQQMMKHNQLSIMYIGKASVVFWGVVFGVFIFNEILTLNKIIGLVFVVSGITLMVRKNG